MIKYYVFPVLEVFRAGISNRLITSDEDLADIITDQFGGVYSAISAAVAFENFCVAAVETIARFHYNDDSGFHLTDGMKEEVAAKK